MFSIAIGFPLQSRRPKFLIFFRLDESTHFMKIGIPSSER